MYLVSVMRLVVMEKFHCDVQGSSTKPREGEKKKTQRKRGKQIIYTEFSHEEKPKTFATLEAMERERLHRPYLVIILQPNSVSLKVKGVPLNPKLMGLVQLMEPTNGTFEVI